MRNFDEERQERIDADREFQIGGERFVRRSGVKPHVMFAYEDMKTDTKAAEAYEIVRDTIFAFVEPDGHERLQAVLDRDDDPVTIADLNRVLIWLISETTGRPTGARSSSPGGGATTGTQSTEDSSTEPAVASLTSI